MPKFGIEKRSNGRGNRQFSSGQNPWAYARYWEWRDLSWRKRLLTRHPFSKKLFRLV